MNLNVTRKLEKVGTKLRRKPKMRSANLQDNRSFSITQYNYTVLTYK